MCVFVLLCVCLYLPLCALCVFRGLRTGLKEHCLSAVLPYGPSWLGVDVSVQDGDVESQRRR